MKRAPYMSRNELTPFLKVGCCASELGAIAEQTQDPIWKKKLKTSSTYLSHITDERVACLDREQILSVDRRRKNAQVVMLSEDAERYKEPVKELVKVDLDDLETLAELALDACQNCLKEGRGEKVQGCPYRKTLHRLGIMPAVDSPKAGQCEFVAR